MPIPKNPTMTPPSFWANGNARDDFSDPWPDLDRFRVHDIHQSDVKTIAGNTACVISAR